MKAAAVTLRGEVDERAVAQLMRCVTSGDALAGAICADGHAEQLMPMLDVIELENAVSRPALGPGL
jgi:tRNA-splicing ligase RtcB